MAKKILVIGATSKVGAELVETLVAQGETVKAATRQPGEYRPAPGVEVTALDYDVRSSFKPALQDVDRVFMLTKWTDLRPEMALNQFIERAVVENVQHLVFMSALGVDKEPVVGLPLVEKRIANSGIGYTILHPNWFMQNFSRGGFFLPRIRDISAIVAPAGGTPVSFVDARDIAAVAAAALTDSARHSGKTYTLTGGQALTYGEVADTLEEITGRRIVYQDATDDELRSSLSSYWEADQIDYVLKLFRYGRDGQAAAVEPGLAAVLGREPTTFEQFARDHADAWK